MHQWFTLMNNIFQKGYSKSGYFRLISVSVDSIVYTRGGGIFISKSKFLVLQNRLHAKLLSLQLLARSEKNFTSLALKFAVKESLFVT
jgi:hypothetical protein